MTTQKQKTIIREASYSGICLHTGAYTNITCKPAPVNTGVVFIRKDLDGSPQIKACVENVVDVRRGTTLGVGEAKVHTIEHLLAALSGFGIDNVFVEMNAPELPVGDGSSIPFVTMIKEAGIVDQDAPKDCLVVTEPISFVDGDNSIVALPADEFKVSCTISFNHKFLKSQYVAMPITSEIFDTEIAPARTFCFYHEVEELMDKGLIKGGSLDNAIVIGDDGVFSKENLRFDDEFARHKILDIIGDLYLLGKPIQAHIIAIKSGHALNVKFVERLVKKYGKKTSVLAPSVSGKKEIEVPLDINKIKKILPHRYPFLMVDRIIETDNEKKIIGYKNLTVNEEFFNGHFPGNPVMPGVLQLEAMAQTAGVLMLKLREDEKKNAYFMAIDNAKFRRTVIPGDQLRIEVSVLKMKSKIGKVHAQTFVDGELASEADLTFAFVDE
ncbi:MAG: bifunctional UDP-3-O-[3-hydroxymyristoyl] N-acetylglucosamine deacetylase/3-hydroxyacyl-ACP dehydratase [Candidatus Ancaeobacter aquaticus]|nr:bifunctional UDP-3-O-[3-hydroxymyristoyl] N-acetylglucosamine deacetylase/3-hydroxyacyl-ACP dehydratase [Candidatus Ancaeobacter aquaticus]